MAGNIKVPLPHRHGLNELIVFLSRTPKGARHPPGAYLRAMRGALRMSQEQLARRAKISQSHITRLEAGRLDARLGTWKTLFDAMECDVLLLPRPRRRPSEVLWERESARRFGGNRNNPWAD